MGATGTIDSEDEARRLLRLAKLGRFSFLPGFLRDRGFDAMEELRTAACRGNLFALRVLAEPTPQPDHLLSVVWRELIDEQCGESVRLLTHVHREGGGYENGYSAYGRDDRVSRDLAQQKGINFLQKPFSMQKLAGAVRECLEGEVSAVA